VLTTGILGSRDNAAKGIGAAPDVTLVFSAVKATGVAGLADVLAAFAALMTNKQLQGGDVMNVSLGVNAGLDITQPYPEYPALLAKTGTHRLVTEKVGADTRPSGVVTILPIEFEPTILKLIAGITTKDITVVVAAGNGLRALSQPRGSKTPAWVDTQLGANLAGPWRAGKEQVPVATFRGGLAKNAVHTLDRAATASFADGGGIVVAGGQFSTNSGGMIDNIQLNHGNRIDCYASIISAQGLGFVSTSNQIGGTSNCAPVIAGAVAVVQGIAKGQFKAALRPAVVRALFSDPDFGTSTVPGAAAVGVMPDLKKLMDLLEKPQGKKADLLKAVQAQQQKYAAQAKAALTAKPGSFVHDPYTRFVTAPKGGGSWQPLPLAAETDLFVP
jgi:hypothetical protein